MGENGTRNETSLSIQCVTVSYWSRLFSRRPSERKFRCRKFELNFALFAAVKLRGLGEISE